MIIIITIIIIIILIAIILLIIIITIVMIITIIIKQWQYCWYLDFFNVFGLLIVETYVSLLFSKKKWQGFYI